MTTKSGVQLPVLLTLVLAGSAGAVDEDQLARVPRRTPVVDVFEACRDAVVNISATEIITVRSRSPFESFFDDLFDMPPGTRTRQFTRSSVGSGFVIHPDGYIVTNAHVVAHTADRKVVFTDGREYDADIVAEDMSRDIAVLKIDAQGPLPALRLGRSDDLMIGETVIAIGNALGYQSTVTAGVVSAVGRSVAISPQLSFDDLIQTDASINPGNSGGPLLNVRAELIGVNTAIRGDAENIGFAIPVDRLREVLPDLLDVERRYRVLSGLRVDSVNEPRVVSVTPGSPAAEAGIRPGDILRAIDGRPVREGIEFDIALINRRPGDTIGMTLGRGDRDVQTRLTLAEPPMPDGDRLARERMGIEVYPLPRDVAADLGLERIRGLLVTRVERGGPADEAGIRRRDVILALGRHHVSSLEDLGQLLDVVDPGEVISVRVLRVDQWGKVQRAGPLRVR